MAQSGPIYITDLDRCGPADRLSAVPGWKKWRTLPYEAEGLAGTMLFAGEETVAPEVSYPLEVRGWHRIALGLYRDHFARGGFHGPDAAVEARLSGDRSFTVLSLRGDAPISGGRHLEELPWKIADLTGQTISFRQLSTREGTADEPASYCCTKARLAYVKLTPLSQDEVRRARADASAAATRTLYAHNDAHAPLYLYRSTTREDIYRELEPYRDTDFSRMYWECGGGDIMFYLGSAGRLPTCERFGDFDRTGDRLHAEAWRTWRDRDEDPFRIALEYAHDIGLEFHAIYRTAGFHYPAAFDQWNDGLYERHPELGAVDRQGRHAPRLSYTYPETRQFVISLLREVARYPIDGVCILYNRRPPLVEYEPPLVDGFRREYGEDPRQLDERDPRWLAYRCGPLTAFMRELREAMDETRREHGHPRRIEVSAIVNNGPDEDRYYGMDLATWIGEGTVDTIIPYTSAPRLDSTAESWPNLEGVSCYVDLVRGTSCRLAMNVMPRLMSPDAFRRKAAALYGAGVEHLFFWDCAGPAGRANFSPSWAALARLGHRDEIAAWQAAGEPPLAAPRRQPLKLGDWDLSYVTPG